MDRISHSIQRSTFQPSGQLDGHKKIIAMKLKPKQNTGDYLNSEFGYTKDHLTDGGKAAVGLTYASNDENNPEYNEIVYLAPYTLPEITVKAPDLRLAKAARDREDYKALGELIPDAIGSVGPWAPVYWGYKGAVGLKEGVPRTYNYAKNGQWGDAALSFGDNILSGLMVVPAVGEGLKVGDRVLGRLSPAYNKVRAARELANEINEAIKIRSELSAGDLGYIAKNSDRVTNEWNLANRIDRVTTGPDATRTPDEIMQNYKELLQEIRLNPEENGIMEPYIDSEGRVYKTAIDNIDPRHTRLKVGDVEINDPASNYREGLGLADDFINTGKVRLNYDPAKLSFRERTVGHKKYINPMFSQGKLWWSNPKMDLLVTREPLQFATSKSTPASRDIQGRRIPFNDSLLNFDNTTAYKYEDGYGYRKVPNPNEVQSAVDWKDALLYKFLDAQYHSQ